MTTDLFKIDPHPELRILAQDVQQIRAVLKISSPSLNKLCYLRLITGGVEPSIAGTIVTLTKEELRVLSASGTIGDATGDTNLSNPRQRESGE